MKPFDRAQGRLLLAALLALAPLSARAAFRVETVRDPATGASVRAVAGQVLVRYKAGAGAKLRAAAREKLSAASVTELGAIGYTLLALPEGMSVEEALSKLAADPAVEAAQPNHWYRPLLAPNDPLYPEQYALGKINAAAGWEYEIGESNTVTVAVIDSGIDPNHPDLAANLAASGHMAFDPTFGTPSPEPTPADGCGHGTNSAGMAAAVGGNSTLLTGVSWKAKLLSLRVFNGTGSEACGGSSDAAIANAMEYAVALATTPSSGAGRVVINLSLGECTTPSDPNSCGPCSGTLTSAVNLAKSNNVPVVAAAGNADSSNPFTFVECPGKIPGVIAVGASDQDDAIASFSGKGPEVVLAAPGVGVLTTRRIADGGGVMTNNGTSFAAPQVAGAVALALSLAPTLASTQVLANLEASADDLGARGFDNAFGYGRLNLFRFLRLVSKGSLSDFAGQSQVVAFPNPAEFSRGSVSFMLPPALQGPNLSIKLFTITGDPVRTLSGPTWDGKNDAGVSVATGVYIYLVSTDNGTARGRVAVVH